MKKILVPIDGSKASEKAAVQAIELAKKYDSEVLFLMVEEIPPITGFEGYDISVSESFILDRERLLNEKIEQDKKLLDAIANKLDISGIKLQKTVLVGEVHQEIISTATDGNYDLIVMGRRGLSKFKRFIMGSVTQTVISASPCSVLVVKE